MLADAAPRCAHDDGAGFSVPEISPATRGAPGCHPDRPHLQDAIVGDNRCRRAASGQGFRGTLLGSSNGFSRRLAQPRRRWPPTSGTSSTPPRRSRSCGRCGRPCTRPCRDREPVGSGSPPGRCDRRQRASRPRSAAPHGPSIRDLRADNRRGAPAGGSAVRIGGAAALYDLAYALPSP